MTETLPSLGFLLGNVVAAMFVGAFAGYFTISLLQQLDRSRRNAAQSFDDELCLAIAPFVMGIVGLVAVLFAAIELGGTTLAMAGAYAVAVFTLPVLAGLLAGVSWLAAKSAERVTRLAITRA